MGGDELNVCVALSLLGRPTKWLSVLPKRFLTTNFYLTRSPLGEVISDCANHANVDIKGVEWESGIQAEVRTLKFLTKRLEVFS